jgi:hypothetical protein
MHPSLACAMRRVKRALVRTHLHIRSTGAAWMTLSSGLSTTPRRLSFEEQIGHQRCPDRPTQRSVASTAPWTLGTTPMPHSHGGPAPSSCIAYDDDDLAERIRELLVSERVLTERRMLVGSRSSEGQHGVRRRSVGLLFRVDPDDAERLSERPRPMVVRGQLLNG